MGIKFLEMGAKNSVPMKTKFLFYALPVIICVVVLLFFNIESTKHIELCLGDIANRENVQLIDSGLIKPWVIINYEVGSYRELVDGGSEVALDKNDLLNVPSNLKNYFKVGDLVHLKKVDYGRYLYVALKNDCIYIWSVSI